LEPVVENPDIDHSLKLPGAVEESSKENNTLPDYSNN